MHCSLNPQDHNYTDELIVSRASTNIGDKESEYLTDLRARIAKP